jgi:transposase
VDVEERVASLEGALVERDALIVELRSRIADLEAVIGQDSGNSSTPPARDKTDRRQRRAAEAAERKAKRVVGAKARKPGKQPGAAGSTLERRAPTATVLYAPEVCRCCSKSLADAPVTATATRQVLEIPAPHVEVTDHVAERRRCACGTETAGVLPAEATGPVCWGPRAKAVAAYLMGRQHLPLERCAEAMEVLFDAGIGEGTLAGVLPDAAGRLNGFMTRVAQLLGSSSVVHADETSTRVGVRLDSVHTISTPSLTYLAHHRQRGITAIEAIGVLDHYNGTIVHDGLATYDKLAGARECLSNGVTGSALIE